jgi:hypothetical protein
MNGVVDLAVKMRTIDPSNPCKTSTPQKISDHELLNALIVVQNHALVPTHENGLQAGCSVKSTTPFAREKPSPARERKGTLSAHRAIDENEMYTGRRWEFSAEEEMRERPFSLNTRGREKRACGKSKCTRFRLTLEPHTTKELWPLAIE